MIGEAIMIWTAICERDGQTSAVTFQFNPEPTDAFENISKVLSADGLKIVGLLKGDQVKAFYGVDLSTRNLV